MCFFKKNSWCFLYWTNFYDVTPYVSLVLQECVLMVILHWPSEVPNLHQHLFSSKYWSHHRQLDLNSPFIPENMKKIVRLSLIEKSLKTDLRKLTTEETLPTQISMFRIKFRRRYCVMKHTTVIYFYTYTIESKSSERYFKSIWKLRKNIFFQN